MITARWLLAAVVTMAAVTVPALPAARAAVQDDLRDGDRFFEEGAWQKAAAAFDRAIAKAPGQVSAEAHGKRAAIFLIVRDFEGGLAFIARAKLRHPDAPEVLEQEALLLWQLGRRADAIAVAERVVAVRPRAFTNQQLIGEYHAARDPAKTITAYEAYLAARPADLEQGDLMPRLRLGFAYLTTARTAIAAGDEAAAEARYQQASAQFETIQRRLAKRPGALLNADNGLCAAYTGLNRFDQAVTVCERIVRQPKRIDAQGSVWFNLGTAYLARKLTKQARAAALEFTRMRGGEARGLRLVGDTYFAERDWKTALEHYLRAEKLLRPDQRHEQVQLSIRLGKTYRRLPRTGAGAQPNLAIAIDKLSAALAANPTSGELAVELGGAYLEAKQDAKVVALTDRLLGSAELSIPAATRANILVIAGKALFNQRKLREARQRFEAAQQLRPTDVTIRRALVLSINEQAFEAGKDSKLAQTLLEQALPIDPGSPVTVTNLAVLAIERGDCDGARQHLVGLAKLRGHDVVVRTRLLARTYLCGKPVPQRAAEAFAAAAKEARKANAPLALAEIYTEWAPLTWDTDLADALEKLELAVQTAGQDPAIGGAARRNLALALFRRGWRLMRDGQPADASIDFERALRDPGVLKGTEALAFELAAAFAQVDAGKPDAARLFRALAAKGNQASYLKPPFAKLGGALFAAYAGYRSGPLAARRQAAAELAKLEAEGGDKLRQLLAGVWEAIAYDEWRTGQRAAAAKSLQQVERYAPTAEARRRLALDRAALALGPEDVPALEGLAATLPEALVNLGIVHDQLGRPKEAYELWQRARARGLQSRELQKWLEAKKRIYGW